MTRLLAILRSSIVGIIVIPMTLVFCIFVVLTIPFGHKVQYKFARAWAHLGHYSLSLVAGLNYTIEGKENLPESPSVVFMKHESAWETVLLFRIVPQMVFVLKRELLAIPVFGAALKSIKMIDIDRSSGSTAVNQVIQKGSDRLAQGLWVSIFPEGTRMDVGKTRRFGKSGAYLAHAAGVPLVVIAHNAGEFWGRKTLRVNPGTVRVIISEPILPDGKTANEMLTESEEWMAKTMRENFPVHRERAEYYAALIDQE